VNFKDYCKLREEEMPASPQAGGGEGWAAQLAQAASRPYVLQKTIGKLNSFDPDQQDQQQDQQGQQGQPGGMRSPASAAQATRQQGVTPGWFGQQPGI